LLIWAVGVVGAAAHGSAQPKDFCAAFFKKAAPFFAYSAKLREEGA
jgi:hypothetical protein